MLRKHNMFSKIVALVSFHSVCMFCVSLSNTCQSTENNVEGLIYHSPLRCDSEQISIKISRSPCRYRHEKKIRFVEVSTYSVLCISNGRQEERRYTTCAYGTCQLQMLFSPKNAFSKFQLQKCFSD